MYNIPLKVGEQSSVRMKEFDFIDVNISSTNSIRNQRNLNTSHEEIALGLNLLVYAFDDYTVNTLEPVTSLPLFYSKLID